MKTYMKHDYRSSSYNCKDFGGPDLCLGKEFDFGLVIAFGWHIDDEDRPDECCHAVMMLVPDSKRRIGWNGHDFANYAVGFLMRDGSFTNVKCFANIVQAAEAYADEYGQDV